jgi:hypothetical protein
MLVSAHVDDLKITGTTAMTEHLLSELTRMFGELKVHKSKFEHCGVMHEQNADMSVTTHQNHYCQGLYPIDVSTVDCSKPSVPLTTSQHNEYRSLLGGLSWLSMTRLDVCIYTQALQRAAQKPTIANLLRLNTVVRWVRRKPSFLHFQKLIGPVKIMVISDAAFRREDISGLAMKGAIVALCEDHDAHPGGRLQIMEYSSRRQRRIVRSTFGAELNSLGDSLEFGKLLAYTMAELHCPSLDLNGLRLLDLNGNFPVKVHAAIDCKSIYDSLRVADVRMPTEAALILLLLQLKEMLKIGSLSALWWIDTRDMLSDGLNKGLVSRKQLLEVSAQGVWKLQFDALCHREVTTKR